MKNEEVIEYFLSKQYAIMDYPFDEVTPVFKVGSKMFALISVHEKDRLCINLKNTPEDNILLRQLYKEVIPGYHMNKIM